MKRKAKRAASGFLALLLSLATLLSAVPVSAAVPETESPLPLPQIKVEETEHGTILIDGEAASVREAYPGEEILLSAQPEEGYQLEALDVTDGQENMELQESEEGIRFTMPETDVTVKAVFAPEVAAEDQPEEAAPSDVPTVGTNDMVEVPGIEPDKAETEETENRLPSSENGEEDGKDTVSLYRYITFYDTYSGDINQTVGYHVKDLIGTVKDGYIEAVVNDYPEAIDLQETDGYPKVILNYAMNQGRQTEITGECTYDPVFGVVRIPEKYKNEFITVKSVMCDFSTAYQMLVPEDYRVNKNLPAPLLSYEDGPTDDTDWAVYGVIPGSCNDTAANGDISSYQVGDRIEIRSALVQTVARNTSDVEGTLDLYDELGMSEYRTGFGWTGFAVSLDCGEGNPFTNIGNPGTGSSVRTFPGIGQVALNTRNWMYARCCLLYTSWSRRFCVKLFPGDILIW